MNKSLLTVALAAMLASSVHGQNTTASAPAAATSSSPLGDLTVTGIMDYESQYVFRGKKITNSAFQPSVNFAYPVYGGTINAYMWTNQPIGGNGSPNTNEIDSGIFYTYPMNWTGIDGLSADMGFQNYWYPDSGGVSLVSTSNETHLGITYDTSKLLNGYNINPSIYYYHDWTLASNTLQFNLSYTWVLDDLVGVKGVSLVPAASVGWTGIGRTYGPVGQSGEAPNPPGTPGGPTANWRNSYIYYAFTLELDYKINSIATAFVGFRYSGNNDGTGNGAAFGAGSNAQAPGSANSIWGGAGLKFGL